MIEVSTGSEINEDLHDGVEISLGTPVGGLKVIIYNICVLMKFYRKRLSYVQHMAEYNRQFLGGICSFVFGYAGQFTISSG